jgi:ribosome-associated protein
LTNLEQQNDRPIQPEDILQFIAQAMYLKKGVDIVALDVSELVYYTDFFLICSGRSDVHVKGLYRNVERELSRRGITPLSVEGQEHCRWVLMDFGPVIVHIFYEPLRDLYELEKLWTDGKPVALDLSKLPPPEPEEPADDLLSDFD